MTIKDNVNQVVNEIYKRDGQVKPSTLVEEARPKSSPVHDAFEWDNKKASEEYRLLQARQWIRRVTIVIEDRTERFIHVPILVSISSTNETIEGIPSDKEGYYKPISIVAKSEDEYDRAMSQVVGTLKSAQNAFNELKEIAEIKKAKIDIKKVDKGFKMIHSALQASA